MKPFDHIVFDLDDTLLDTYRQLLPRASRDACTAMIAAGLRTDLTSCIQECEAHRLKSPRRDLFEHLLERFGISEGSDRVRIASQGYGGFYRRQVETDIALFPGAREMLTKLRADYRLHLVTSGHRPTQEAKIRILDLESLFDSVDFVDPAAGERKRSAFALIMERTKVAPERYLSVGNRIDTDIAEARALGWRACWLRYGEYARLLATQANETPDFIINRIEELPSTCRL